MMQCETCGEWVGSAQCPDCLDVEIQEHTDALRKRIADLEAIVDRLRKTADGVPVLPGMSIWFEANWGDVISDKAIQFDPLLKAVLTRDGWRELSQCYSMCEAAEKAKGES